ncbi:Piwi domain-containing protein [Bacteroides sp.]|uniref:Piwi domain-containing protein n=1 Tax=Bacteroides sp. TaxID=29523 RepID=UPI0025BD702E|nr:Piwi domain-containing protein [Bacteroides sp.]
MANIRLNILPVKEKTFSFKVYRKLKQQNDIKNDEIYLYNLPQEETLDDYKPYWISFTPKDGFEEYITNSYLSIGLSKKYLLNQLVDTLENSKLHFTYKVKKKFTDWSVEFIIAQYLQGNRIIYMSPYFLEEQNAYGFIIDFKFSKKDGIPFDKDVQKLSLSLDSNGRSNKNYYTDKFILVNNFIKEIYPSIKNIGTLNSPITISTNLIETTVFHLNKKEYIFSNNNISSSQFQGIRNFGVYKNIPQDIIFAFIFEDRFRSFANELYLNLIGKLNPGTFPGLDQMFSINMNTKNVRQIKLNDHSLDTMFRVVDDVKSLQDDNPDKKIVGIYIEDCAVDSEDIPASNNYYFLKYHFIKNNLPLQVVNYRKLGDRNSLKWSTSNLALAMFAKMGGIPWVVKPSNKNCLILGIGSSHKINRETGEVSKYFAYTVCLDSSGLYKTLEVLADEESEISYLKKLTANLVTILKEQKSNYETCVLHLPFKIKQKEVTAISDAIKQIDEIELVVVKINVDNKYFGYSFHNTLVPYESSFVKLSKDEYLVWFEGLLYGKEIVDKRLSNPVHIQFLNITNRKKIDEQAFLQDILNLSGANWRGFNAKSIPISIYYSQIIARYTEAFEKIDGYKEGAISNDKPWFL